jgi:hypothetical protein
VIDSGRVTLNLGHAASVAALMLTTEAVVAEELIAQPGAIVAPGFRTGRKGWRGRRRRCNTREKGPAGSFSASLTTGAST